MHQDVERSENSADSKQEPVRVARLQFSRAGRLEVFLAPRGVKVGEMVIADTERGQALGQVMSLDLRPAVELPAKLRRVIRRAQPREVGAGNVDLEQALRVAREHVAAAGLEMTFMHVEGQFDGHKIVFFFSAPKRVDFRNLVRDLAAALKARIELKQVGARDEAKLLGGVGVCGRQYCCSTFLREFIPVSIRMAKNQNLALNPQKVSGGCGRLLCCLSYEDETYSQLRSQLPPRGVRLETRDGSRAGKVVRTDLLNQIVTLQLADGEETTVAVRDLNYTPRPVASRSKGTGLPKEVSVADYRAAQEWVASLPPELTTRQPPAARTKGRRDTKKPAPK